MSELMDPSSLPKTSTPLSEPSPTDSVKIARLATLFPAGPSVTQVQGLTVRVQTTATHGQIRAANQLLTLTPQWLAELLEWRNPAVLLEAARLKGRLCCNPWYAQNAAKRGDKYWLELASSYGGRY